MKILISDKTAKLPNGARNAKEYPYWEKFFELAKDCEIKKIDGVLTTQQIKDLIEWCDVWISIDTFLPHLAAYYKIEKKGIIIFGQSDPLIFGYNNNINLLKSRTNLRTEQFRWWNDVEYKEDVFVSSEVLFENIWQLYKN